MPCTFQTVLHVPSQPSGCAIGDQVSAELKGHQEIPSITVDDPRRKAEREHNLHSEASESKLQKCSDIHSNAAISESP